MSVCIANAFRCILKELADAVNTLGIDHLGAFCFYPPPLPDLIRHLPDSYTTETNFNQINP